MRVYLISAILSMASLAHAASSTVASVTALPLSDRSSVVLQLTAPAANAGEADSADATTVIVEVGPLDHGPRAETLTPDATLPCIADVTVRAIVKTGAPFARMVVRLHEPCAHGVRVAGSRGKVDTAPAPAPPRAAAAPDVRSLDTTDVAQTYATLEADATSRAAALAARPDVKALQALRVEIDGRDAQLGHRRPDVTARVHALLDLRLAEARALQLKLDGIALRQSLGRDTPAP